MALAEILRRDGGSSWSPGPGSIAGRSRDDGRRDSDVIRSQDRRFRAVRVRGIFRKWFRRNSLEDYTARTLPPLRTRADRPGRTSPFPETDPAATIHHPTESIWGWRGRHARSDPGRQGLPGPRLPRRSSGLDPAQVETLSDLIEDGLPRRPVRLHHRQRRLGRQRLAPLRGPGQVHPPRLREPEAAQGPQPDRQHALASWPGPTTRATTGSSSSSSRTWPRPGDVLLAISGSGNSPNILKAVEWANAHGLTTVGHHRLRRRQAQDAGPAQPARRRRRHGDRRVAPPGRLPLGHRRPLSPVRTQPVAVANGRA